MFILFKFGLLLGFYATLYKYVPQSELEACRFSLKSQVKKKKGFIWRINSDSSKFFLCSDEVYMSGEKHLKICRNYWEKKPPHTLKMSK